MVVQIHSVKIINIPVKGAYSIQIHCFNSIDIFVKVAGYSFLPMGRFHLNERLFHLLYENNPLIPREFLSECLREIFETLV